VGILDPSSLMHRGPRLSQWPSDQCCAWSEISIGGGAIADDQLTHPPELSWPIQRHQQRVSSVRGAQRIHRFRRNTTEEMGRRETGEFQGGGAVKLAFALHTSHHPSPIRDAEEKKMEK